MLLEIGRTGSEAAVRLCPAVSKEDGLKIEARCPSILAGSGSWLDR